MHLLNRRLFLAGCGSSLVAAAGQDETPVFTSDTRLVVLHASVVNSKGQLVTNLPQSAFKVFENGVEQPLRLFRREDVPVALGLVIDNSGSMRDKRSKVEAASLAFVKASNPRDRVFIVNFNEEAYRDVDFTSEVKKLEEGLARIDSRGGTAFFDALSASLDYLKQYGKLDKKVLMLITDGNDTASTLSAEKLLARLHGATDVLVHSIGLLSSEEPREAKKAKRSLEAIGRASGGLCFFPKDTEEVEKLALQVAHDIRNQYILGYTPTNASLDGTYRTVKVTATGPGSPVVRTRSGYFATAGGAEPKKVSQQRNP